MKQHEESGLLFSFPTTWYVFRFDKHRFFRMLTGEGLKGVDFIGLTDLGQLFLLEVKNYRNINQHDGINPSHQLVEAPDDHIQDYILKFEDTERLISVAYTYYQRRWWFRHLAPWMMRMFPGWSRRRDWGFWKLAYEQLSGPRQHWLFLQLEEDVSEHSLSDLHEKTLRWHREHFNSGRSNLLIFDLSRHLPFHCHPVIE